MKSAAAGLFFFLSLSLPHSFALIFFFSAECLRRVTPETPASERAATRWLSGGANEALGFLSTSLPIIVWRRRGRCRPSGFNF